MHELTTNQKRAIAEAATTKEATALGIIVSRPTQDAPYDLIFDRSSGSLRVQCKWAGHHGDVIVVYCRRARRGPQGFIRRSYEHGEIDAIAAYCWETDQCYFLPWSCR